MTAPNMAIITASLERSLQNCSLYENNNIADDTDAGGGVGFSLSSSSSDSSENHFSNSYDAILDLNSHLSLPYHWEQCLNLKTGEIYYVNSRTRMKAKEDPRTAAVMATEYRGSFSSQEEEEDSSFDGEDGEKDDHVLVVAGCKSCLMYFMVSKQVGAVCPKCCGQLLRFDPVAFQWHGRSQYSRITLQEEPIPHMSLSKAIAKTEGSSTRYSLPTSIPRALLQEYQHTRNLKPDLL
ncbi:uncharacterized protein LOC114319226 [Camellia sinensis]|uniref:uncharacterized protein LOC114319226 n=1 Tax=Camellia sinensis TaxID=4442 RepID=UPI0010355CE9|nr:uncharacterized protein LOC114319226 [Camellia sinensis]